MPYPYQRISAYGVFKYCIILFIKLRILNKRRYKSKPMVDEELVVVLNNVYDELKTHCADEYLNTYEFYDQLTKANELLIELEQEIDNECKTIGIKIRPEEIKKSLQSKPRFTIVDYKAEGLPFNRNSPQRLLEWLDIFRDSLSPRMHQTTTVARLSGLLMKEAPALVRLLIERVVTEQYTLDPFYVDLLWDKGYMVEIEQLPSPRLTLHIAHIGEVVLDILAIKKLK